MEEFQALLPPRPRWLLQLAIELAGIALFGVILVAAAGHDRATTSTTRPRRWRCRSGCSWGRWLVGSLLLVVETAAMLVHTLAARAPRRRSTRS